MQCYQLSAGDVPALVDHLGAYGDVYAPHQKGDVSYSYERVTDSTKVVLDYNRTLLPLKKFFLPPTEKLLDFSVKAGSFSPVETKAEPRLFFAIHSYELEGIKRLDHSMLSGNPESNYFQRRKLARFVGISFEPDEYHFSESVGIPVEAMDGFDLFLNKIGDDYQLHVITPEGIKLLEGFDNLTPTDPAESPKRTFTNRLRYHFNRLPKVFEESYDSEVWQEVAEKCVGCGTCNLTCPTCYCFDVTDEVSINADDGSRERHWDSCMLQSFAEVAGGENFREKLSQRTRHRLYRKFKYITDQEGLPWCVGCGRCSAFCTAGISLTGIVNALISETEEEQYSRAGRVTA